MSDSSQPERHQDVDPLPEPALKCSRCDFDNAPTAQFCSMCGRPLEQAEAVEEDSDQPAGATIAQADGVDRAGIGAVGKLFVIPLLIVIVIVGMLLFARLFDWITIGSPNTATENLQVINDGIQGGYGEPGAMGAMSPKSKRVMKAAQEFARQAQQAPDADKANLAASVSKMLAELKPGQAEAAGRDDLPTLRYYLILALGMLNQAEYVEDVVAALDWPHWRSRQAALLALQAMRDQPAVRAQAARVARMVHDSNMLVQVQAAQLAGHLGSADQGEVVSSLTEALRKTDQVAWNAALSLVYMKADVAEARRIVRDMLLNRQALESASVKQFQSGAEPAERPLDPAWVQQILVGAAEVAGRSGDRSYVEALQKLAQDSDPAVKEAALKALDRLDPSHITLKYRGLPSCEVAA